MSQTRQSTDSKTHAGARRGEQVLKRLRENPPNIWYAGEQVRAFVREARAEAFAAASR